MNTGNLKKAGAFGTAVLLGAGIALAAPLAASAETKTTSSWAWGQFLTGTIAGIDLTDIVELEAAEVANNGKEGTKEEMHPLVVNLLNARLADLTGALQINPDDIIDLSQVTSGGVLGQYAMAQKTGSSLGASGLIGDSGAIGPDAGAQTSNPLTLTLDTLLADAYSGILTDLRLEVEAIGANATGSLESVSGDYLIDGVTLKFTSPAVKDITTTVQSNLVPITAQVNALTGPTGLLATNVNSVLSAANPALNLFGSSANVSVAIAVDLPAAVAPILTTTYGGEGVSLNLATGEVSVDLEALTGNTLNNKPANFEVLSDATVTKIVSAVASEVTTITEQVKERVRTTLEAARLDVDADLTVLTPQAPILGSICTQLPGTPATPAPTPTTPPATGGLGGLLGGVGGLVGGVVGGVTGTVGQLVCTPTSTALPSLNTSASVDVHGTLGQVLNGTAPATITAKVLNIPLSISTGPLLAGLNANVLDRLFDADGALAVFNNAAGTGIINSVNSTLLGTTSVDTVLSDILSLKVNVQETTLNGGGMAVAEGTRFTQTAMRLAVLPSAANSLTTLNVASAAVSPTSSSVIVDPPTDPPTEPPVTIDDPTLGPPSTTTGNTSTSAVGRLAFTGMEIWALIAFLIAALATGTVLAREGYRRNHPKLTIE